MINKITGFTALIFAISFGISLSFAIISQGAISQIILISTATFLFAIFSTYTIVEGTISPVKTISQKLKRIAEGKTEEEILLKTGDELQELTEFLEQTRNKFRETLEREREVSKMKSEFLTITAHQLRTPLSELKWSFYETLKERQKDLPKDLKELLQNAYSSNERIINVINSFLNVVQIEEGRFEYKMTRGSLADQIQTILKEIQPLASQKHIELSFGQAQNDIPKIDFDQEKFRLAFENVLYNAIQYTPSGGKIWVNLKREGNNVVIDVRDTGIGILREELPRIFTKFFRGSNAKRIMTDGNGLGLFIAKNILEGHNGTITVISEEGKGSVFSLVLPVPKEYLEEKHYEEFIEKL